MKTLALCIFAALVASGCRTNNPPPASAPRGPGCPLDGGPLEWVETTQLREDLRDLNTGQYLAAPQIPTGIYFCPTGNHKVRISPPLQSNP